MYFIGFNVEHNGSMEEFVKEYIIENKLNNDEEDWENQEWGFLEEIDLKFTNEKIFSDVDEDYVQTNISSKNMYIKEFIELSLNHGDVFINEHQKIIEKKEFHDLTKKIKEFSLSICQCLPNT